MSPKHFFFSPEDQRGTSNLDSRTGGEAITVTPNLPGEPDSREIFLGISMNYSGADRGEAWAAVDANELRDAIDKAAGKREEEADWRDSNRVEITWDGERITVGRETVGKHAGQWAFPNWLHYGDGAVATLDPKAVPASASKPWEGSKPYRPIDRDRLLRHIEDLEATLTRRNERHERDQERIRELEAERARLEAEVFHDYTARECLQLAWEAAVTPEDGTIHAGEEFLCKDESGIRQPALGPSSRSFSADFLGVERRLLEPRVEPAKEDLYRKDLESKGLAEWEIELLVGPAA